MSVPTKIIAGDSYEFTETYPDYPADGGWSATLHLVGDNPDNVAASPDGSSFTFTLTAAETATWPPGLYRALIRVSKAGEVHTVDEVTLEVMQNPANAPAGYDFRSHARRTLDAIKATMEGRATKEHKSAMVGPPGGMQTEVSLLSPEELVYWLNFYQTVVDREEQEDRLNKGLQGRRIFTRFDAVP